ncbi:MAG TPA: hypothetical protein VFZ92_19485 [Umezawaea sp.]
MNGFGTLGVAGAVNAAMVASCNVAPRQLGTDAEIGGALLRDVFAEAPGDGSCQRGDDPVVRFAMFRETDAADVLLGVRTSTADDVELRSDEDYGGTVQRIPVPLDTAGSADPTCHLRIVDFSEEVLAGTTISLTFSLEDAGETAVETVVKAAGNGDAPPARCSRNSWS